MRTENLAIMFTDIKGYTERTGQQSHRETGALLRRHENLVVPIIQGFDGRVIKAIGDAFLVTFRSPTAAVLCGMTIQDQLHRHNHALPPEQQIHLRVAINVGEVLVSRGDVFGEPVNIASRVEGVTPANEVFLTEAAYLTMNRSEVSAESAGTFELKGIREPVKVYRVPPFAAVHRPITGEFSVPNLTGAGPAATTTTSGAMNVLVLPYGGVHLARLDTQVLTPGRRKQLFGAGAVALAALLALVLVPPQLREREWQYLEALVGRGETGAAMTALARMDPQGESDRRRYQALQQALVSRLLDRGEAGAAAALLGQLEPTTPEEASAQHRLHQSIFQQLVRQKDVQNAVALLARVRTSTGTGDTTGMAMDPRAVYEERLELCRLLLEKGRLDELQSQLHLLAAVDGRDARARVLEGHLHVALSTRADKGMHLLKALAAYREALEIELAAGDDARLRDNVAAAYSHGLPPGKQARDVLAAADSLVERYLGARAVEALVHQLGAPNNSKEARDRLAARIEQLGAQKEVDRVGMMLQDLAGAQCRTVQEAAQLEKLVTRLRDEGGKDPRAVGALLALAQRHDACQGAALDALHRLAGERVGFITSDQARVTELLEKLRAGCKGKLQEETVAELVRLGDPRAVGPLLRQGVERAECVDAVQKAAEAIIGRRVVFEPPAETRLKDLLAQLRAGSCTGRKDADAQMDLIRALARHGDRRAAGELLGIARKGNACSDAALNGARELLANDHAAVTCVHPALVDARNLRCKAKKDAASALKLVDALVADADVKSAGELVQLAARRSPCSEAWLDGARKLLKVEALSLATPATPAVEP